MNPHHIWKGTKREMILLTDNFIEHQLFYTTGVPSNFQQRDTAVRKLRLKHLKERQRAGHPFHPTSKQVISAKKGYSNKICSKCGRILHKNLIQGSTTYCSICMSAANSLNPVDVFSQEFYDKVNAMGEFKGIRTKINHERSLGIFTCHVCKDSFSLEEQTSRGTCEQCTKNESKIRRMKMDDNYIDELLISKDPEFYTKENIDETDREIKKLQLTFYRKALARKKGKNN